MNDTTYTIYILCRIVAGTEQSALHHFHGELDTGMSRENKLWFVTQSFMQTIYIVTIFRLTIQFRKPLLYN